MAKSSKKEKPVDSIKKFAVNTEQISFYFIISNSLFSSFSIYDLS